MYRGSFDQPVPAQPSRAQASKLGRSRPSASPATDTSTALSPQNTPSNPGPTFPFFVGAWFRGGCRFPWISPKTKQVSRSPNCFLPLHWSSQNVYSPGTQGVRDSPHFWGRPKAAWINFTRNLREGTTGCVVAGKGKGIWFAQIWSKSSIRFGPNQFGFPLNLVQIGPGQHGNKDSYSRFL